MKFDDGLSILSGGRAIQENLALDQMRAAPMPKLAATIPLASLPGITVPPVDWKRLIEPRPTPIDPLAELVPSDQHAVLLRTAAALGELVTELESLGSPIAELLGLPGGEVLLSRLERQWGIGLATLAEASSRGAAITGSDPHFAQGTDVALLIDAGDPDRLERVIDDAQHALQLDWSVRESRGFLIQGCGESWRARVGSTLILSSSAAQLLRILEVAAGALPSLASLDELRFFRQRYPLGEQTALLVITDAAIRRWSSPRWRIAQARRLDGRFPRAVPIIELPFDLVTPAERDSYLAFRAAYSRSWGQAFDPIAVSIGIERGRIELDTTVLPLTQLSEYRKLREIAGGEGGTFGDAPEAIVHLRAHLDRDAPWRKSSGGMVKGVLGSEPFSWLGDQVELLVEPDPVWAQLPPYEQRALKEWAIEHWGRLRIGVRIAIDDPLRLTVVLGILRTLAMSASPLPLQWEPVEKPDGSRHVRIVLPETGIAILYALRGRSLLITTSEPMLERRSTPAEDHRHLALRLERPAIEAIARMGRRAIEDRGVERPQQGWPWERFSRIEAGLTFENDGLRARLVLDHSSLGLIAQARAL